MLNYNNFITYCNTFYTLATKLIIHMNRVKLMPKNIFQTTKVFKTKTTIMSFSPMPRFMSLQPKSSRKEAYSFKTEK